jgi:hypothetical protein
MNCKQIREEIDTASRRSLRGGVRSHLNDCPDCRRYADETTSLIGLLGAQPRVEAPADFEFRLRARLARAQAAESDRPQGFLWKILSETFSPKTCSWRQMGAAAATIAMVITVSTFYLKRDDRASGSISASQAGAADRAADPKSIGTGGTGANPEIPMLAAGSTVTTPAKFINRSPRVGPAMYSSDGGVKGEDEVLSEAPKTNDFADIDGSTLLYNPETKRLLNDRSRFYGAETVSISLSKPAGAAITF